MPQRFKDAALSGVAWLQDAHYWLAALPAAGLFLFGASDNETVQLALSFILFDLVTGLLKGSVFQSLSSRIALAGVKRKAALVAVIAFGHLIDRFVGSGSGFKTFFAYYVCSVEGISILENITAAGVVLPDKLQSAVKALFQNAEDAAFPQVSKKDKENPDA